MNKLLVVEDEVITSDLLRRYFEMVGYDVINALNGSDAVKLAVEHKPEVIILDIMLPDMDGYTVCKKLRADVRTDGIPIIFLTQKDERRDLLDGLGLGADDYVTKPFDVEELRLRVHNIISRMGGTPLVDPRTSLPNLDLMKQRLPKVLKEPDSVFLDVQVTHWIDFGKKYGPVAANQVIRGAAKVIGDLLHEVDPRNSFIAHPRDDHFLLAVKGDEAIKRVEKELPERFTSRVKTFYDETDVKLGKMKVDAKNLLPLMSLKMVRVNTDALKGLISVDDEADNSDKGKKEKK